MAPDWAILNDPDLLGSLFRNLSGPPKGQGE